MQDKAFPFEIKAGSIAEVVALSQQLPEFDQPHGAEEYERRLSKVPHIILLAIIDDKVVGFKVGYERDGYFYSWMGGVLPAYRRIGIAQALADTQEKWAKQHNYPTVTFRTRNRHKAMLRFALGNGFNILAVEPRDNIDEYRIVLRKDL